MAVSKIYAAAALAVGYCGLAQAQTPLLSGSYILSYTSTCPALVIGIEGSDPYGGLGDLSVASPGSVTSIIGVAAFNPTLGIVQFQGQSTGSGTFQYASPSGSTSPLGTSNMAVSSAAFFTNNTTSIFLPFLNSINPTYVAFYTPVGKLGISHRVTFSNLGISSTGAACVQTGTLIGQ